MSLLISGDLHFKPSNERQTSIILHDIMNIISTRLIIAVILLGDILDNHEKINMECYNRACDFFELILSTGVQLFVLIGNHDRSNNKVYMTNRHPFRGYCNLPNIKIIDRCYIHEIPLKSIGVNNDFVIKLCFVPFVPDGMYLQALSDCNIDIMDISIFFSHSEFDGCKINKLTKSKCDVWRLEYPLNLSGHIHDEEQVQDNLIYLGTPYQQKYGDSTDKGLFLMDLTTGEYKLEKIKTSVPIKVIWKIHYTQLEQLVLNNDLDIRLDIHGPTQYVKELMRRPDMITKFASVCKRYKDETVQEVNNITNTPLNDTQQFYQVFLSEVSVDEKLKFVYQQLFK